MEQVEIPSMVSVSSSFPVVTDSSANNVPFGLTRRQRGICKYRGVVSLHNGTWGAQIYAKRTRIWLGTFKSEVEAAKAYDSAAVKLRREDSSCNFPRNLEMAAGEVAFLSSFSDEDVISMIKDRSYQAKFDEFLKAHQVPTDVYQPISKVGVHYSCCFHGEGIIRTELFDKELTPSDVGKLKRLVIPKKHATKHFPPAREDQGLELEFMDEFMKPWKFRYCYWESSQSYVFTKGWGAFVTAKWLKEKDVVVFYGYDQYVNGVCGELELRKFLMIEVRYSGDANGDVARLSDGGSSVFGGICGSSGGEVEKKRGFKLFGFDISS